MIAWFMFHPLATLTPMGLSAWIMAGWWLRGRHDRWQSRKAERSRIDA